jgi:hypothetical protein
MNGYEFHNSTMKSILFVMQAFDKAATPEIQWKWNGTANRIETTSRDKAGVEHIGNGCLMINSPDAMGVLAEAIRAAEYERIPYKVLFVESATEWTKTFTKASVVP